MTSPDWIDGRPAELRAWRNARPEVVGPSLPPGVAITPVPPEGDCPGGLLFTPPSASGPDIVYFHGGGFVVGSPETHWLTAAWLAQLGGARVFSARCRLAPEHALPAQLEDAAAAIRRWLTQSRTLRLAGESAGALVALWGHAALTPKERLNIAGALLVYGGAGHQPSHGPSDAALDADGLGPRSIAAMYSRIDPIGRMPGNHRFDPFAPGFPLPTHLSMLVAGSDPFRCDSLALDNCAIAAGLDSRVVVAEGLPHSFLTKLPEPAALEPLTAAIATLNGAASLHKR